MVVVAEERTTVANVLAGKLTDERLTAGRLDDGIVAEDTLVAGILIELILTGGRPGTLRLTADGIPTPTETIGTLIGAGVGTGTPTYSTLTDTTCGGLAGVLLALLWILGRIDNIDVGGMGEELVTGIVAEGIWTGFAETRERKRKRRVVGRCMA